MMSDERRIPNDPQPARPAVPHFSLATRHCVAAFTLTELMISIAAATVLVLAGWAMWEFGRNQTLAVRAQAEASRTAFGVLQRIEQDVMRAEQIEVPDPDYGGNSMQVRVPSGGATVRRAFRLSNGRLVIDMKDEPAGLLQVFGNITGLTFAVLDAPSNTHVRIACAVTRNGEQAQLQTVAKKRN